jgi:hypothetical protein
MLEVRINKAYRKPLLFLYVHVGVCPTENINSVTVSCVGSEGCENKQLNVCAGLHTDTFLNLHLFAFLSNARVLFTFMLLYNAVEYFFHI